MEVVFIAAIIGVVIGWWAFCAVMGKQLLGLFGWIEPGPLASVASCMFGYEESGKLPH